MILWKIQTAVKINVKELCTKKYGFLEWTYAVKESIYGIEFFAQNFVTV